MSLKDDEEDETMLYKNETNKKANDIKEDRKGVK